MKMYIVNAPTRDIHNLVNLIHNAGHEPLVEPAVWAANLSESEINEILSHKFDLKKSSLQIGWRDMSLGEIATTLSHHNIYVKSLESRMPDQQISEWICVMEDDITLFPEFFERIAELEELKLEVPTIITLFTRGKRYASRQKDTSQLHKTLLLADIPPGQTCLYLMNKAARQLATSSAKVCGDTDWPLWARNCRFYLSYPWVGIESSEGTTLPVYERSRVQYYLWRIKTILGIEYWKWLRQKFGYGTYFFFILKPWLLRILFRFHIYKPADASDPNSVWVRK